MTRQTHPEPELLKERLIEEIRQAFAGVSREDGITLHEANVIDLYGSDVERAAARRLDRDERWEDVPDDLIESHPSILTFLDAKGFRYYLPAYMVWALRNLGSDSLSVDFTIYALSPSRLPGFRRWSLERYGIFNSGQATAICRFLRFMADCSGGDADDRVARKALDRYWNGYCEPLG